MLKEKEGVLLRYIKYALEATDISDKITGTAPKKLTLSNLRSIVIPIPSEATQRVVVDFLDRMWTLTQDKKEGLRGEIWARQRQFDYYLESLFTA